MKNKENTAQLRLPSVDDVLRHELCLAAAAQFGRSPTVAAARQTLDALRTKVRAGDAVAPPRDAIATEVMSRLEASETRNLRRVFNLTGTVLHTNLGRALLSEEAIAAAVEEQGAATQEISRNVQQASMGTQQVSSNIGDVQRGASETGSASSQVLAAAQSLSGDSNRLKLEVGKFLDSVRAA